jgi:hypothetical protein
MAKKKAVSRKKVKVTKSESLDPVFVPLGYGSYKRSKIDILSSEVKLLECTRTLNRIKELQDIKRKLKLHLYRNLSDVLRMCYQTQVLLPEIRNRGMMRKVERIVEVSIGYKEDEKHLDEVDKELREIQEKLNMLNSSKDIC